MTHDNEWLKVVASTCLGLIAGLVAEPLKNGLNSIRTKREISRAIKTDLRWLSVRLPLLHFREYDGVQIGVSIDLPAFEHYWSTSKGAFYGSTHLRFLQFQCDLILRVAVRMRLAECPKEEGLRSLEEIITAALRSRELSLFKRLRIPYRSWKYNRKHKNRRGVIINGNEAVVVDNVSVDGPKGTFVTEGHESVFITEANERYVVVHDATEPARRSN